MKKYFCNITFLTVLLMVATSCSPKSEGTKFDDLKKTQYTYEPRNEDRQLVSALSSQFQIQKVTGLEKAQSAQIPWAENSTEIFRLAENAMELGDNSSPQNRTQYKKFGHDLLRLFYQAKENSTQFDKSQTLYLSAALGFEGEKIKSLFKEMATGDNLKGAEATFKVHHIQWPSTQPTLRPIEFIKSIKEYLLGVAPKFAENGVGQDFIKTFSAQLDKDYIQAINNAEVSLKNIDQNQSLKVNARVISDVIKTLTFIPESAVKVLSEHLVKAKLYADLIEKKNSSNIEHAPRLVQVIASIWLDLTPQQREKYIKPANEMLYSALNDFSEKMLTWLAGRYELLFTDMEYYWGPTVVKPSFINKLKVSCHPDVYSQLNSWVQMNDAQRAEFRGQHLDLYNVFSRYTSSEIKSDILVYYKDAEFDLPFTGGSIVKKFSSEVEIVCLNRIQALLDKSINLYLLSELDIQIRSFDKLIEKVVADKTIGNLEAVADSIESQEKFQAYFEKMAYPLMENMVFNAGTIHGLENSKVQLFVDSKNQFSTKRQNLEEFETGAEVLGTSLAAQYRRLQGFSEFEGKTVNSKEYYREVFAQINKMLSIIGFRTMDNKLVPSLHRSFYGERKELDVYKYECSPERVKIQQAKKLRYTEALREKKQPNPDDEVSLREDCEGYEGFSKTLFAIPDQLKIRGPFTPGPGTKYSSIRAQAEIIRGSAYMLQYFNDWRGLNDFDAGMGKETFSEIVVFPKSALVNLAVAAMTTPIRGLQKENSPLKLFNVMGQEMLNWAQNGIPDPDQNDPNKPVDPSKQIIQAAVVDLLSSGPGKIVKSEDMAYFMVAVDEFLKATDGIEQTHASVINPPQKTVKENMEAIIKGRRLLKMMMYAMSNFLVTRLQDQDGGFWAEYSLESSKIINKNKPRTLENQLVVIDALTRVYQQWGSEGALVAAVESYYYMNQKLWNDETSFYRSEESLTSAEVKPYLYLKAVMNFKKIEPYLNNSNSAAQAKSLFDYYSKEFLKWNQSSKPMATQLN